MPLPEAPIGDWQAKEVAIVIATHNSAGFIGPCLASIESSGAQIIVIDNGSKDETKSIIRRYPEIQLIETDANLGYGKAINLGAKAVGEGCKYLILSNPDVIYRDDSVATLISFLKSHPEIGITGPRQVSPTGGWQRSYADTPGVWVGVKDVVGINSAVRCYRRLRWPKRVDNRPKEVGYVCGAVLALPRVAYLQANGFDEDFYFYSEESDLCLRLRKMGWKVVFCPFTEIVHYGGGSSTRVDTSDRFYRYLTTSQTRLAKKHLPLWKARIYVWLQKMYFQRLAYMLRFIRIFAPTRDISRRIEITDIHVRLWADQLNQLRGGSARSGSVRAY
jgi:N-acetylglucosaminyl-diphospho-decaprenol L-rhamnosyltransferase